MPVSGEIQAGDRAFLFIVGISPSLGRRAPA